MLLPPNVVSEYELEHWFWRCIHNNKELSDEGALEASCNEISERFYLCASQTFGIKKFR